MVLAVFLSEFIRDFVQESVAEENKLLSIAPVVAAAQESQRNRYITAWFSSFTPAWFFTGFD